MTINEIAPIVSRLGAMKYFPGDIDTRLAVAEEMAAMGCAVDQAHWLVRRILALYAEWPGTREMRAVYCSRWRPADGIECGSIVYLEGIPADQELAASRQIASADVMQISGEISPTVFPRDAVDLLHDAIERRKAVMRAPLPTEADIAAIKAAQDAARTGR